MHVRWINVQTFTNGHQSPIIGGCIDRTLLWRSQLSDVLLHNMVVTIASDVYVMLTFVTNPEKLPFSELFAQSLYRATPVQATMGILFSIPLAGTLGTIATSCIGGLAFCFTSTAG